MTAIGPELDVAVAAMAAADARFVVVGGFSVIANRFIRATEDIDLLVPDDDENDRRVLAALTSLGGTRLRGDEPLEERHLVDQAHLRARTDAGIIDIIRGGFPPRLTNRPRDRNDLIGLEEIHGKLPIEEIPGLDG